MLKPDAEVFEYVIRDLDTAPERIAFFDDLELNVKAAQQVGMQAFHTRGIGELEAELGRLGVI
jgi:putative hydrolase of the HAD superfamily